MSQPLLPRDIEALYGWYRSVGITEFSAEQATDWFDLEQQMEARRKEVRAATPALPARAERSQAAPPASRPIESERRPPPAPVRSPAPAAAPPTRRSAPAAAPDQAVMPAGSEAKSAKSLGELKALLERFDGCGLKATAKSLCLYRGAEQSRLMLIGEAPGRDEDIAGKPFVGRAGQRLNQWLTTLGLSRADVYIANVLKCRPPGNRDPRPEEVDRCSPFLQAQIRAIAPAVLVALGRHAGMLLSKRDDLSLRAMRGATLHYEVQASGDRATAHRIPIVVTYHPAYVLRQEGSEGDGEAAERLVMQDLERALAWVRSADAPRS